MAARALSWEPTGRSDIVNVADVGVDALLVHDMHREDPSLASALARLANDKQSPTPFGVFRQIERPEYTSAVAKQLVQASSKGPGDLGELLRSNGTWMVG